MKQSGGLIFPWDNSPSTFARKQWKMNDWTAGSSSLICCQERTWFYLISTHCSYNSNGNAGDTYIVANAKEHVRISVSAIAISHLANSN